MNDHLHMKRLKNACPVMVAEMPKFIRGEIKEWVKQSRKFKNHPLAELRAHENVGYNNEELIENRLKHNSYQCSIPAHLVDQSFWLGWVLRLAAKYWGMGGSHRDFYLRELPGHFDRYDIWTNFSYKGDDNPMHDHAGYLSGVIYHQNHKHPTIFDHYQCGYEGLDGTMVMFPASTWHHVEKQTVDKERITLAFNISRNEPKDKRVYTK